MDRQILLRMRSRRVFGLPDQNEVNEMNRECTTQLVAVMSAGIVAVGVLASALGKGGVPAVAVVLGIVTLSLSEFSALAAMSRTLKASWDVPSGERAELGRQQARIVSHKAQLTGRATIFLIASLPFVAWAAGGAYL